MHHEGRDEETPEGEGGAGGGPEASAGPARIPLGLVAGFYGALLAAAWIWRELVDGVGPWRAAGAAPDALAGWPAQLALGLAAGVALALASRAWTRASAAGARLAAELARLVGPVSPGRALLLALASGIAEEAFFRGALQPRVGLLLASLLFGLAHWGPTPALRPWALYAAVVGLGFGALFAWTGTLVAPAAAHVATNAVNLVWLGREPPPDAPSP
jgi:membrane protease YdiL (CAAX protease family)